MEHIYIIKFLIHSFCTDVLCIINLSARANFSQHHMLKGKKHETKTFFRFTLVVSCHSLCKPEVMLRKFSSVQGIMRPPIGWLKPNSSSAILSSSWNEGWFKYDTGITYLLFSPSPTYTAKCPLGTSSDVVAAWFANRFDRRRMYLALKTLGKRIAITEVLVRTWERLLCFTLELCEKSLEYDVYL